MVSMANFSRGCPRSIPGKAIIHQFVNSDIVNFFLKINDGRYRRPNFAIRSASYPSARTLQREGSISSYRLYGQLLFTGFLALSAQ